MINQCGQSYFAKMATTIFFNPHVLPVAMTLTLLPVIRDEAYAPTL